MKIYQLGNGANFIRPKDEQKYVFIKVKQGAINAIRIYDGKAYIINEEEELELVII